MIGKGAVRSERVSFRTLAIVKLIGMVCSQFRSFTFPQKCKTVTTLIGRWWGEG